MCQIIVFGDSITYGFWDSEGGWVTRLRKWIDQKNMEWTGFYYRVYNLGIDGNTTEDLLARIEDEIITRNEEGAESIIIFAIGINDSQYYNGQKKLLIPLKQYKNNILQLIAISKKYSNNIIFLEAIAVDEKAVDPIPWAKDRSYLNGHISKFTPF